MTFLTTCVMAHFFLKNTFPGFAAVSKLEVVDKVSFDVLPLIADHHIDDILLLNINKYKLRDEMIVVPAR